MSKISWNVASTALDFNAPDRLQALVQVIDDGFCVIEVLFDDAGRPVDYVFLEVNPAFESQTGLCDAVGRRMREFAPTHEQYWFDLYAEVAHTGETLRVENRAEAIGRWYEVFAFRVGEPGANLVGVLFRDIGTRKEQEAELQRAVRVRTEELEQAHEQLRQAQKMEAVGQLTGGIAHDFNNLLQGITGSLELMRRHLIAGRTDGLERFIGSAMNSAQRAAALTHRLLAFSRRQPLAPEPTDANPLVASMEDLVRRSLGEHIDLVLEPASDLWCTRCDPNQLESAILNLCINARDAMPDGGRLTIATANAVLDEDYAVRVTDLRPGEYVCVAVSDTGAGMPPDVVERAFDPFFTTKPLGQGTGLGLSMIYGFARQSGGHVRIYSTVGQGTTVKLYLPRHVEAPAPVDVSGMAEAMPHVPGHESVLVLEDDPVIRALIVEALDELGYRVMQAADGPTGLAMLTSSQHIDVLVTDIGLPGLNGRQVADSARTTRPALRVLFMTGYAESTLFERDVASPHIELITKPFQIDVLTRRLRALLDA